MAKRLTVLDQLFTRNWCLLTLAVAVGLLLPFNVLAQEIVNPDLWFSTPFGGSDKDQGKAIAVDGLGNVYVGGETFSTDFPTTPGAFDEDFNGTRDGFLMKIDSLTGELVYSTYLGGSDIDSVNAVAVDDAGNAYITGFTYSDDFPVTPSAYDRTLDDEGLGWGRDAFVAKLDPTGQLVYSTYLGGSTWEYGYSIVPDAEGCAYVGGFTHGDFPTTAGAFDTIFNGNNDAFISKLDADGTALVYSTYVGGSDQDAVGEIFVDTNGIVYYAGNSNSTDFPVTDDALDRTCESCPGGGDGVVVILNEAGSGLIYATYLGGEEPVDEYFVGITVDDSGNIYVLGLTSATNFPTTADAFQTDFQGGSRDSVIAKLSPDGHELIYSSYFGGAGRDSGGSIEVNPDGQVYVTGATGSTDFPVTASRIPAVRGQQDQFVALINDRGSALLYSDTVGGSADEGAADVALVGADRICMAGSTLSADFPAVLPLQAPAGSYDTTVSCIDVSMTSESISTLILTHIPRMTEKMSMTEEEEISLRDKIRSLAEARNVNGFVVDLNQVVDTLLYDAWDDYPDNPLKANEVLFGVGGIHEAVLQLVDAYPEIQYLILVGDDRIIPMARVADQTPLLPETEYAGSDDLTADGTTVGRALAAGRYLSDDPLASRKPVAVSDLETAEPPHVLPGLAVGRLVESPAEIGHAIESFLRLDGEIDLRALDPVTGHHVQLTGYDFLLDSAKWMREVWQDRLGQPDVCLHPVDGMLVGSGWNEDDLVEHLCGNAGHPYRVLSLNGHATHYGIGHPGFDRLDIRQLSTERLTASDLCPDGNDGHPLDLIGSIAYSAGCHSALPVAGGSDPGDHLLDLPQAMLSLGMTGFLGNTGYSWGLLCGVGYSERLATLMTEELSQSGSLVLGVVVGRAKRRYHLETPRFDAYDAKTSMQWTLFGFPMLRIHSNLGTFAANSAAVVKVGDTTVERFGPVTVERRVSRKGLIDVPPPHLNVTTLDFNFSGDGAYKKYNAAGDLVEEPGCPVPARETSECSGCYYRLNGLVERSTGVADMPVQPYFVYESGGLSGTVQHGVLWTGSVYRQEDDWVALFADLVSNGGELSDRGSAPTKIYLRPRKRKRPGNRARFPAADYCGEDQAPWPIVVTTGETVDDPLNPKSYSIQRTHLLTGLEVYYYDEAGAPAAACDWEGPVIEPASTGVFHYVTGQRVNWTIRASDPFGVWKVVVVYDDEILDADAIGEWVAVELADADGDGTWTGGVSLPESHRATYFIQAVDLRGNVSWLLYEPEAGLPSSGIPFDLPRPIDVSFEPELFRDSFESGDCSAWSACDSG